MKARIKRVIINPLVMIHMMKVDTVWRVTAGVPKTARLSGFTLDPQTQNLILFVEDDSFEEVNISEDVAPLLPTEFRTVK